MGQENEAYKAEQHSELAGVDALGKWSVKLPDGVSGASMRVGLYDTQNTNALVTSRAVTRAELTAGTLNVIEVAENAPLHLARILPKTGVFSRIAVHGKIVDSDTVWSGKAERMLFENEATQQVFFTINTDSEGNFSAYLQGADLPMLLRIYPQAYPHLAQSVDLTTWDADNVLLFLITENANAKAKASIDENAILEPIDEDCNCNHNVVATPQMPSDALLTGGNKLFSQDINGCESLTKPDRTIEEFRFFKVMRTTTPLVRGFIEENIEGKTPMLRKNAGGPLWLTLDYPMPWDKGQTRAYNEYLQNTNGVWQPNPDVETYLDTNKRVFQAVTFGYGLALVFKQRYMSDGHSKGQLLNSLPLAPRQKEQVAILSWDREDSASRSEVSEASDMLTANLSRNRDISDVASGTVRETVNASSSGGSFANTGGFSVAADLSFIGVPLGVSGGYQGSSTSFNSQAMQDAVRNTSMDSLQKLRDATNQSASSVRSQRSTVVQTTKQSERVAAKSSVIANHNPCHSITVFYHEVLAQYIIEQTLADVKECIFIPMQMQPFEAQKIVRYLNVLKRAALFSPKHPMWADFEAIEKTIYSEIEISGARNAAPASTTNVDTGIRYLKCTATLQFEILQPAAAMSDNNTIWLYFLDLLRGAGMLGSNNIPLLDYFNTIPSNTSLLTHYNALAPAAKEVFFNDILKKHIIDAFLLTTANSDLGGAVQMQPTNQSLDLLTGIEVVSIGAPVSNSNTRQVSFKVKFASVDLIANPLSHNFCLFVPPYLLADDNSSKATVSALSIAISDTENGTYTKFAVANSNAPVPFVYDTATSAFLASVPLKSDVTTTPYTPPAPPTGVTQRLIDHLNHNLEYYHRAIWYAMDRETRFNILDGIVFYKTFMRKNALGIDTLVTINTTVASIVDNVLMGVAGNSLVMPIADGVDIGNYTVAEGKRLYDVFKHQIEPQKMRISVPTPGVFAEMQMGECCVCEKRDDSLIQDGAVDEPTAISTLNTDSRYQAAPNMQAKDFAQPIINIQNAPQAPDPQGFGAMAGILGSSGLFKDMTGLEGGQKLAQSTLEQTVEMQKQYAGSAERIAGYAQAQYYNNNANRVMDNIRKSGLPKAEQDDLVRQFLGNMVPGGSDKKDVAVVPTAENNIDAASKMPAGSKFTQNANGSFSAEIGGNANQNPLNGINTIIGNAADTYTPDATA